MVVDVFRDKWITYDLKQKDTVMKFVNYRHMSTLILEVIRKVSHLSKKVHESQDLYTNENVKSHLIK